MKRQDSWSADDLREEIKQQAVLLRHYEKVIQTYEGLDLSCPKCGEAIEAVDLVVRMACTDRFLHVECAKEEYCEEEQSVCLMCGNGISPDHIRCKS